MVNASNPYRPGQCNAVGVCPKPVVGRVITESRRGAASDKPGKVDRFSDDMCAPHIRPYVKRLLSADPGHIVAIVRLPEDIREAVQS